MATTQDLAALKTDFDAHIGALRESFSAVEMDVTKLASFTHDFTFSSLEEHQHDDNDVKNLGKEVHDKAQQFTSGVAEYSGQLEAHISALTALIAAAPEQMQSHLEQHTAAHQALQEASQGMSSAVEAVTGTVDQVHTEYIQHVQEMSQTLSSVAEKVFGSATQLGQSVKDTQLAAIDKASTEFHALIDSHIQGHLPGAFEEAVSQLTQHVQGLGQHATTAADTLHQEVQTLIADLTSYAQQEIHDKVEQKFHQLMQEAVAFLMQEIMETIVVTTTGVATTGALAVFIPELAVLKKVLDGLKEAIKIFKTLEEIF